MNHNPNLNMTRTVLIVDDEEEIVELAQWNIPHLAVGGGI